jgi:hypothetical protein
MSKSQILGSILGSIIIPIPGLGTFLGYKYGSSIIKKIGNFDIMGTLSKFINFDFIKNSFNNIKNKILEDVNNPSPFNVAGMFFGAVMGIILFVTTCFNISEIGTNFSKISNPEFYAIQLVVKMVK